MYECRPFLLSLDGIALSWTIETNIIHMGLVYKWFDTSHIANMIIDNNASRGGSYKANVE